MDGQSCNLHRDEILNGETDELGCSREPPTRVDIRNM